MLMSLLQLEFLYVNSQDVTFIYKKKKEEEQQQQ